MPLGVEVNPELEKKVVVFLCQDLRSFNKYYVVRSGNYLRQYVWL